LLVVRRSKSVEVEYNFNNKNVAVEGKKTFRELAVYFETAAAAAAAIIIYRYLSFSRGEIQFEE